MDISKIRLSGTDYDIKDTVARQMITGGLSFNIVWTVTDFQSNVAPTDAKLATIPQGVIVQYHNGASGYEATGTMTPEDSSSSPSVPRPGFYLVYRQLDSNTSRFDEYVVVAVGSGAQKTYLWEKIGNTSLDLKGLVTDVTLAAETTAVYGTLNTFTNSTSNVTASGGTTITAITGVAPVSKELSTTQVPSSAIASASLGGTTTFNTDAVKCSYASETLTISAASTGTVSLSTSPASNVTVATGGLEDESSGMAARIMIDVDPTTDTAIKTLGTLTAAAQSITVGGTNKSVLDSSTTINVQKHS